MDARRYARAGLTALDQLLAPLARAVGTREPDRRRPAIFVVGGPRSGSTLYSQVALACRRLAYTNNLIARFPRSAPFVARALRIGRWPVPQQFDSEYGDTRGPAGPSEGGDLWDWVFPWSDHHGLDASELTPESERRLQWLVRSLARVYEAPLLTKNLWNSVRIEAIDRALPDSLFVVMLRDPLLMAQSMLRGRSRALGDQPGLWSIRPREIVAFRDAPPAEQVAMQLVFTYRAIESARRRLGGSRFLEVSYEDFCRNPEASLTRLDAFLLGHGVALEVRRTLGRTFEPTSAVDLEADTRRRFEAIFSSELPEFARSGLAKPRSDEL
jgi:Sulfotransferase family